MKAFLIAIASLALLAACETPATGGGPLPHGVPEPTQNYSEASLQRCNQLGGVYGRAGMMGWWRCTLLFADGGKVCSDSTQCRGKCKTDEQTDYDPNRPQGNQTGFCAPDDNPFGCYATVENGVIQPMLCVD